MKKFYTNDDVDTLLIVARKNTEKVLPYISQVASKGDVAVLRRAVTDSDFVAEDFDRYDSDVCERFLTLMEITGMVVLADL